jgi:hypothetical protein
MWKKDKTTDRTFTTERSWSNLSKFIQSYTKKDAPDTAEVLNTVLNFADRYLASSTVIALKNFLQESMRISINDILNRYIEVKPEIKKCQRDKISELLNSLKEKDITKVSTKQLRNIMDFLHDVDADERIAYLKEFIVEDANVSSDDQIDIPSNCQILIKEFKPDIKIVQDNLAKYDPSGN